MVNVFITGATGKMGKEIISATEAHPRCNLVGASGSKNNDLIGQDLGELLGREELGIFLSSNFINCNNADVIIDFSFKDYSLMVANYAAENKIPLVIGTTGFNEKECNELELHAQHIPLLITPNRSSGINFIEHMIEMSGDLLIPFDDIKIEETHESPLVMLIPLMMLSIGAIFAGFLFKDLFVGHAGDNHFWADSIKFLVPLSTEHPPTWFLLLTPVSYTHLTLPTTPYV